MSHALQQSIEFFHAARALGWPVRRRRSVDGVAWTEHVRCFGVLGRVRLITRAPHGADWLPAATRRDTLVLNAERTEHADLWKAGFWPVMTPATLAVVPLRDPREMRAALHQKWRNRLNASYRAGIRVDIRNLPADSHHWLIEAERAQAARLGYRGLPPELTAAYAEVNTGAARLLTARVEGIIVAGAALLTHGDAATWQIAVTTPRGRSRHAVNALLWEAMCWARSRGCVRLDLGTIDTMTAPGLARFKMGTGAQAVPLSGTWLHHPALAPFARAAPVLRQDRTGPAAVRPTLFNR